MTMTYLKYNDPENRVSLPVALGAAAHLKTAALPAGEVRTAIESATNRLKSFQIQLTAASQGVSYLATVVTHPTRAYMHIVGPGGSADVYINSDWVYLNFNGNGWRKTPMSDEQTFASVPHILADTTGFSLGGDVIENGKKLGRCTAYKYIYIGSNPDRVPVKNTCTYDKKTFLTQGCRTSKLRTEFLRYDDPRNEVSFPSALKSAPDLQPSDVGR